MVARTTLVLTDRAGTPVSHSFTPDGEDANGVHLFSEKTAVDAGNPTYSVRLRRTDTRVRSSIKLEVPVVATQTISGVSSPVVVRRAFAEVSFTFDRLSTEQERKDTVGMLADSLRADQAMINGLLTGLNDIY